MTHAIRVQEPVRTGKLFGVIKVHPQFSGTSPEVKPGVRIIVRRLGATEIAAEARSDFGGRFEFPNLPPGDYQLESCLDGWISTATPVRVDRLVRPSAIVIEIVVS